MPRPYVPDPRNGDFRAGPWLHHRGGRPWTEADPPPRRHICTPHTRGEFRTGALVLRCSCGALSTDGTLWSEAGSRAPEGVRARFRAAIEWRVLRHLR